MPNGRRVLFETLYVDIPATVAISEWRSSPVCTGAGRSASTPKSPPKIGDIFAVWSPAAPCNSDSELPGDNEVRFEISKVIFQSVPDVLVTAPDMTSARDAVSCQCVCERKYSVSVHIGRNVHVMPVRRMECGCPELPEGLDILQISSGCCTSEAITATSFRERVAFSQVQVNI